MEKEDYKKIIESKYNREAWKKLFYDIFKNKVTFRAEPIKQNVDESIAKEALLLGWLEFSNPDTNNKISLAIYEVALNENVQIERNKVSIRNLLLSNWHSNGFSGAFMFCYKFSESVLRFSYVSEYGEISNGTWIDHKTDPKRYTYFLGEGHRSRTAIDEFFKLKNEEISLQSITKAFSIETLSERFFEGYKKQYEDIVAFITGKRMVKVQGKWIEENTPEGPNETIMQEFYRFENPEKTVRDYIKKLLGRLVFLQFLQKKGWLGVPAGKDWGNGDRDYMHNLYDNSSQKDDFIDKVLEPLFYDLNCKRENDLASSDVLGKNIKIPYLNGGLFETDSQDEATFKLPERYISSIFSFFDEYNFTIDENDPDDAEVGIDPEMLGRIFENLLEDNKDKGAFYTPKEIVQYMCKEALVAYLITKTGIEETTIKEFVYAPSADHAFNEIQQSSLLAALEQIRICDPAIGSGAFPMGLLNLLYNCRVALTKEDEQAAAIKRHIIENSIYGVDIEKGAVDIARLRFWLALIVDEDSPSVLPNMDFKIVEGNSLITTFMGHYLDLERTKGKNAVAINREKTKLHMLQNEFFEAKGNEKYTKEIEIKKLILKIIQLQLGYEKDSRTAAIDSQTSFFETVQPVAKVEAQTFSKEIEELIQQTNALIDQLDSTDMSLEEKSKIEIHFFDWKIMFPEIWNMENHPSDSKGFDIVIGNPPYIQLQNNHGVLAEIYEHKGYKTLARTGDIYCLFYERGIQLLVKNGHLCYITSNKWMRAGYGEKTRGFFVEETNPVKLIDFAGVKVFENATVDVNILILQKSANEHKTKACITKGLKSLSYLGDYIQHNSGASDFATNESWVVLSPIEQSIKRKIEAVGTPLKDWNIQINYGIKTGCNEAFIISGSKRESILNNCLSKDERERTEELIRPILRGRDIKRYSYDFADRYLIATFPSKHYDIEDYPAVKDYLLSFGMIKLEQTGKVYHIGNEIIRSRKRTNNKWFETQDSIGYWEDFYKNKIIYIEIMTDKGDDGYPFPCFSFDKENHIILNTGYIMSSDTENLYYILGVLNSKIGKLIIKQYVSQLQKRQYRMLRQFISLLPIARANHIIQKIIGNSVKQLLDIDYTKRIENEENLTTSYIQYTILMKKK